MASVLKSSDVDYWYTKLNRARTLNGLSAITEPTYSNTQTRERIINLINNISASRTANSKFLGLSDYTITESNFDTNDIIKESDKATITSSIVSMLRVCNNISCQTVCNNTGAHNNGANSNGNQSNGLCSNTSCSNVAFGNVAHSNGTCSNTSCSNVAYSNGTNSNSACLNGTQYVSSNGSDGYYNYNSDGTQWNGTNSNGANSNGAHTNGTNSNGANTNGANSNGAHTNGTNSNGANSNGINSNVSFTNGCSDSIYDPNTATYAAKNYYSEKEALKR